MKVPHLHKHQELDWDKQNNGTLKLTQQDLTYGLGMIWSDIMSNVIKNSDWGLWICSVFQSSLLPMATGLTVLPIYGCGESVLGMDPWGVKESSWKFQSWGENPLAWEKSFLKNTYYPMLFVHVSILAKRSTKMKWKTQHAELKRNVIKEKDLA